MINIVASTKHLLEETLGWLEREQAESVEGFFCNKDIIVSSHHAGEFHCGIVNKRVVGLVIHTLKTSGASIDISEVHPQHRGRGIGTHLAQNAIGRLRKAGASFVTVQCSPRSSEPFWRFLGFVSQATPRPSSHEQVYLVLRNVARVYRVRSCINT